MSKVVVGYIDPIRAEDINASAFSSQEEKGQTVKIPLKLEGLPPISMIEHEDLYIVTPRTMSEAKMAARMVLADAENMPHTSQARALLVMALTILHMEKK